MFLILSVTSLASIGNFGFKGNLVFNTNKTDGTMRKLTDVSKLNGLGWKYIGRFENEFIKNVRMVFKINNNKKE